MVKIIILLLLSSCVSHTTAFQQNAKRPNIELGHIKEGKACEIILFGSLKLPYVGTVGARIRGDKSIIAAVKRGSISNIRVIDTIEKKYFLYSKICTIIYGE